MRKNELINSRDVIQRPMALDIGAGSSCFRGASPGVSDMPAPVPAQIEIPSGARRQTNVTLEARIDLGRSAQGGGMTNERHQLRYRNGYAL